MKKTGLFIISLITAVISYGQVLKLQGGTSKSSLEWQLKGLIHDPLYNETLIGYSIFAGYDYFDQKYFNLSSNIGFFRKGGKQEFYLTDHDGMPTNQTITLKATLDYISVNTAIELKYRFKEYIVPFLSFGPRLDYLVAYSKTFSSLNEMKGLNSTAIGLILGGGLKYEFSKLQFGVRADYYLDFVKVAEWTIEDTGNAGQITAQTYTINFTVGYRL